MAGGFPSPNRAPRPEGLPVTALVLHYTGMRTAAAARQRLCEPAAEVSAHYLIDEDGTVEQLVAETDIAWHAGVSAWRGMVGLNAHSIGIELVNPGHEWGYRQFPDTQIEALIRLVRAILDRHPIPAANILAHSDIAPARKEDPGELFPWARLAREGIGMLPSDEEARPDWHAAERGLAAIGYRTDQAATSLEQIVATFQRRYLQARVDGHLCPATMGRILSLAARIDQP